MERTFSPDILDRFAEILERDGVERVPADVLNDLLDAARAVEASAVAMAIVVDPTEPAVVRERAFGLLATQIIGRADRVLAPCQRQRTGAPPARVSSAGRRTPRPAPSSAL